MSVELRRSHEQQLLLFERMEQASDTRDFVIPYSLEAHREHFSRSDIVYLSVLSEGRLAGFVILVLDPDGVSMEFRRIVVAEKGKGIGQMAISEVEAFCSHELGRTRIWLDVFQHNARGRHIYEKLGYRLFGTRFVDEKLLLLYEKRLS